MKRTVLSGVLCCLFFAGSTASAHRIDEYLQASLLSVEKDRVRVSMRLIPGMLVSSAIVEGIDADHDGAFSQTEERAYVLRVLADLSVAVDGQIEPPQLLSWVVPQPAQLRDGIGEIHIEYSVELQSGAPKRMLTLANHHLGSSSVYLVNVVEPQAGEALIVAQQRNKRQSVYRLVFQQGSPVSHTRWSGLLVWFDGVQLSTLFYLGMRHIAEGTDHLLFLLTLLLPAPLLALGSRWGRAISVRRSLMRILEIVTAFTIGHSLTLTLAALGAIRLASSPVEVLVALSILVSAIHALRPIFPGREAFLAGFFGLIHGLAFASALERLGLARWDRLAGIVAFNLGIETMQLLVVAAILPSLLLLSRTPAYPAFRTCGAVFAAAASLGWIVQRLVHVQTGVDAALNLLAHHARGLALVFFAISVVCKVLLSGSPEGRSRRDLPERSSCAG